MKAKIILKSLADLPASAINFATSAPGRVMDSSKQMLSVSVRATRREVRAARRRSAEFMRGFYARVNTPLRSITPWQRGGLNE